MLRCLFIIISIALFSGCASSDLSRGAANSIDDAVGAGSSINGNVSLADAYQNSSQTTKGVFIGGIAGGILGGVTNGVGVVPGAATGAILGGALGAYIDAHTSLVDKLKNRGVKVFVLGDQVMIVIPSNRLFSEGTSHIRGTSYSTLDETAELIGNYANITVKVAGYTNDVGPASVDLALSKQQAENVAKYLWRRGVNTRMLYAEGYGSQRMVTRRSVGWTCNENNRIEITFEKLPV